MARTGTSPTGDATAGDASEAQGFTLIELLVVLAILGLTLVVAVPAFYRVLPGLELKTAAHTVTMAMREAHGLAIRTNAEVLMTVDLDKRTFSVGDGPPVQISPRLGIGLLTATREVIDSGTGAIRFYPDGTSTGGGVTLALKERHYHVVVDWLTGRVAMVE
jgi:general secretion pathway protein H